MTKLPLSGEFFSLCFLLLMYGCYREKNAVMSSRRRVFYWTFRLSAASAAVNIVCILAAADYGQFPHWFHICMNSLYLILAASASSIAVFYVFDLILEKVKWENYYIRGAAVLFFLCLVYSCVVLLNIRTGILFSFTPVGQYVRGPWNSLGYGILMAEFLMAYICYRGNRSLVSPKTARIVRTLPLAALALAVFRFFCPGRQFNGVFMTAAVYILFSNFQLRQLEEDSLTRLGSRKTFFQDISTKMKKGQPFQVISITLKGFGDINLKYGHAFGDSMLCMIGEWLDALPDDSSVYRFANVEFTVVFPYYWGEKDARENANRIRSRFQEAWECGDVTCRLDVAVCDLLWTGNDWTSKELVEYLEAMKELPEYHDKAYVKFTASMAESFVRVKYIENVLQVSLRDKRFSVVLQPFFCCRRQKFCCGEALVRVKGFDGKSLPAGEFIPVAEKMGVLDDITWQVLEMVCEFLAAHRELPLEALSVNLSMEQCLDLDFPGKICAVLEKFHLPGTKLKIEITERMIAEDLKCVENMMSRLRAKGIGFYLDDFGTGYSNFSVLTQLPFEVVKLDKSILSRLLEYSEDRKMLRQMIALFQSRGFHVVCEGIETAEQAEIVTGLGADMIQGFYYARPMVPSEFAEFILPASHDPDPPE